MNIWIDKKTGTWGNVQDIVLLEMTQRETDALDDMSDAERGRYAEFRLMMKGGVLWPIEKT